MSATNRQVGLTIGSEWVERGVINGPILEVRGFDGRKVKVRWYTDHGWHSGEMERGAFISKFRRAPAPSPCAEGAKER